jgi:hypothetical protein
MLADRLSKSIDTSKWTMNQGIVSNIRKALHLPKPTIDGFASAGNRFCKRYISKYWDGTAVATDLFRQQNWNWEDEIVWANPPFDLRTLKKTVDFFVDNRLHGYLIAPKWESQPFWKFIMEYARHLVIIPAHKDLYFPSSNAKPRHLQPTRWDSVLCWFDARRAFDLPSPSPPHIHIFSWDTLTPHPL